MSNRGPSAYQRARPALAFGWFSIFIPHVRQPRFQGATKTQFQNVRRVRSGDELFISADQESRDHGYDRINSSLAAPLSQQQLTTTKDPTRTSCDCFYSQHGEEAEKESGSRLSAAHAICGSQPRVARCLNRHSSLYGITFADGQTAAREITPPADSGRGDNSQVNSFCPDLARVYGREGLVPVSAGAGRQLTR